MCDVTVSDAKSVLPFTSVSAATSTGPGSSLDLDGTASEVTMYVALTGAPSSSTVSIQISLDDAHWSSIGSVSGGGFVTPSNSHLFRYVRANVTDLTGGTSPTVTAVLAVGKVN